MVIIVLVYAINNTLNHFFCPNEQAHYCPCQTTTQPKEKRQKTRVNLFINVIKNAGNGNKSQLRPITELSASSVTFSDQSAGKRPMRGTHYLLNLVLNTFRRVYLYI